MPDKPVRSVTVNLLLRGHAGKAWFRDAELRTVEAPEGAYLFDGVAVKLNAAAEEGFQLRDVAAGTGFVRLSREALGVTLKCDRQSTPRADFWDIEVRDTTGKDRALTLVFATAIPGSNCRGCKIRVDKRPSNRPASTCMRPSFVSVPGDCRDILWLRCPARAAVRHWASTWPSPRFFAAVTTRVRRNCISHGTWGCRLRSPLHSFASAAMRSIPGAAFVQR